MIGQSYFCMSQWNAARTGPPHLSTIAAYDRACDFYRDWGYHGGIPAIGFLPGWVSRIQLAHQAEGHDPRGGSLTTEMRPFHRHDKPLEVRPGTVYELRVQIPHRACGCPSDRLPSKRTAK
jgi:predicted acyl esterase